MAVKRVLPYSRLAEYYVDWAKPKYYWGSFVDVSNNFPIKEIKVPEGIPRWAHLQHIIQNFRFRIIDWLAEKQNPDGQIHGGWNDDTLILRARADICLDSCERARDIVLKVYEGLDRTNFFGDGFCQVQPIDNVHNGDFVRERYRTLIYKLGDPYIYRRALETAWHWDKETPFNWGNGKPFLFDKNILEWYWGKNVPHTAYTSVKENVIDENLSRLASYTDDILFHRFTEARIHTDGSVIYNESYVERMILGGPGNQSISVSWPEGGGEDVARWVTYADSTKLECRMFSFDPLPRKITARLFRIEQGDYEITLSEDLDGIPGDVLSTEKKKLTRFDTITVTAPSKVPVLLTVRQVKKGKNSGPLPDLAVADYDCRRESGTLYVRISNLGAAPSKKTEIYLYDQNGKRIEKAKVPTIDAPTDFAEKSVEVAFKDVPARGSL
ncbi:MAG: hypothetical protein KAG97_12545, partial [Victivallales bacterium]|nr:hypothetical protein [Victivallales bacterium]